MTNENERMRRKINQNKKDDHGKKDIIRPWFGFEVVIDGLAVYIDVY